MTAITLDSLNDLLQKTYDFEDAHKGKDSTQCPEFRAFKAEIAPMINAIASSDIAQVRIYANEMHSMNIEGLQMNIMSVARRLGLIEG